MLLKVAMIVGVALVGLPAFALGVRGTGRRDGYGSGDRTSVVVIVVLRVLVLLLLLALSVVVLLSAVGALIKDVVMPDLVLVFFVLDLLLAVLVLLTFGRRDRRPARRRANPAQR